VIVNNPVHRRKLSLAIELSLVLMVIYSLINVILFFKDQGFLPPPFFRSPNDTLMDWYNVAYWSNNPGAYYSYMSVYPPISFDFLRLFAIHSCYRFDSGFSRDCDWVGRVVLCSFYLLGTVLVYQVYRKRDPRTALMRAITIALGLPMLFALERGQLVIVCFVFFVLGQGRLLRSAWARWLCLAIAINFKPYLIATLLPQALRRRWRWLEGAVLATIVVYLITYGILGAGSPFEIIENQLAYSNPKVDGLFDSATYATTYTIIVQLLKSTFPFMTFLGSRPLEFMETLFPALMRLGQAGVALCFLGALIKPNAVPLYRLTALSTALFLTTINAGGYAQVFLFFLVFLEPWRGVGRIVALVTVYALSLSTDVALLPIAHDAEVSWLSNRFVGIDLSVQLGELIRPALILVIEYALIGMSLADIMRASRPTLPRQAPLRAPIPIPGV